jgi:hypothetical protein
MTYMYMLLGVNIMTCENLMNKNNVIFPRILQGNNREFDGN